jgi:hypothetical protein
MLAACEAPYDHLRRNPEKHCCRGGPSEGNPKGRVLAVIIVLSPLAGGM